MLAVLGLCCCAQTFSSCSEWGALTVVSAGSVVVAPGLRSLAARGSNL